MDMIHLLHKFLEAERKVTGRCISTRSGWCYRIWLLWVITCKLSLYMRTLKFVKCKSKSRVIQMSVWCLKQVIMYRDVLIDTGRTVQWHCHWTRSLEEHENIGGLTRGRGMTEFQWVQRLLSSPLCTKMNHAMQNLTGVDFHSSEQHKETGKSRKARDSI